MEIETQVQYDNYFELFATEGWKQLIKEVNEDATRREQSVLLQDSTEQFHFERGYVGSLNYLYNFEDIVRRTYDELVEDSKDADL